jgi:hypothetical protein
LSYDLWVDTLREDVVGKEELEHHLNAKGWQVRYLAPDAFLSSATQTILPAQGPLEEEATLIGWKTQDKDAAFLDLLFAERDMRKLEAFFAESMAFGGCGVSVSHPDPSDSRYSEEQLTNVEKTDGKQTADILRGAKTHYYLHTSAGRSLLAFEFQRAVWLCIGELTDGLVSDPQEGHSVLAKDYKDEEDETVPLLQKLRSLFASLLAKRA